MAKIYGATVATPINPNKLKGDDGITPHINEEGFWCIGNVNTGVKAAGTPGLPGNPGLPGKSAYEYAQDGGYTGTEEEFAEKLAKGYPNTSVTEYGAKGDSVADDTAAFQTALAENRTVYVPGGTYKLSAGISVGDNCELELAQDAVLEFTQTSGNCITLNMCSSLKGNHATVNVPYAFSGNVLYAYSADTTNEEQIAVPPFTRWSPQWKSGRYVTDLNICKADYRGFHYLVSNHPDYANDVCKGTAVYLSANAISGYLTNMWGIHYSGLRIAGAFEYGIRAKNFPEAGDPDKIGWLHEMRVDAFIDSCETAVSLEDCNQVYVSAIIQPRRALLYGADGLDDEDYVTYAKHGIKLVRSKNVDLSGSRVWDWNSKRSLYGTNPEYQHIAMYGDCSGAIINDFAYYQSGDTRNRIYTDTPSNLEQITVLQEPITRWFKSVDGEPYFTDGFTDKKLAKQEEIEALFGTTMVAKFTNQLPVATDTDGTIYNGIGYKTGTNIGGNYPPTITSDPYSVLTGFIPVKGGSTLRFSDLWWKQDKGYERIAFFDKDKNPIKNGDYTAFIASTQIATSGTMFIDKESFQTSDEGFRLTLGASALLNNVGYVRMTFFTGYVGTNPIITVDEEIKYEQVGILSDGIKVKGENVIGGTSGGGVDVTAEVGQTIVVKEVDADGKPTKWESAEYQPRTHYSTYEHTTLLDGETVTNDGSVFPFTLTEGQTYRVIWNGTAYDETATLHDDGGFLAVFIGNPAGLGGEDNGVPYIFMYIDGIGCGPSFMDESAEAVVTITTDGEIVHQIPQKYIPDMRPYYVLGLHGDDENSVVVFETVESMSAILTSGRAVYMKYINNNEDTLILSLFSYNKGAATVVFATANTLIGLIANPDGTYGGVMTKT